MYRYYTFVVSNCNLQTTMTLLPPPPYNTVTTVLAMPVFLPRDTGHDVHHDKLIVLVFHACRLKVSRYFDNSTTSINYIHLVVK